jgi:D-glycero-D-manno-heptose 1,7-bisphosphate phosphatase
VGIGPVTRAVFLDRDGVLNLVRVEDGLPQPPDDLAGLKIAPDAAAALAALKAAGFLLIVVTNQPDVARGRRARAAVEATNAALQAALPLDDVFVCYHDDADGCACRKPLPGMLFAAATRHGIDLSRSYMIGDRWRDIDAGAAAGCATILLDWDYRERPPRQAADARVRSLADAARWILAGH